ncbi:hypothetical protein T261_6615 [Streptomyces lydicus]|nr:hypothetical protein T261_6615 [Streptomyces lydicus]
MGWPRLLVDHAGACGACGRTEVPYGRGRGVLRRSQRQQEADHTRPKSMWSRVTSRC